MTTRWRLSYRLLLEANDGFAVAGEAGDGEPATGASGFLLKEATPEQILEAIGSWRRAMRSWPPR